MHSKPCEIRTRRLVMKALEDRDRESLLRMAKDEQIGKTYMMPVFRDQEQEDAFFRRLRDLSGAKDRFVFGIFLEGELIGFLNDCGIREGTVELGYFISPEHWNQGYAAEALQASIDTLFRMGFARVRAGCFEGNAASRRVMEKCGMQETEDAEDVEYRGRVHRCLFREIRRGQGTGGE